MDTPTPNQPESEPEPEPEAELEPELKPEPEPEAELEPEPGLKPEPEFEPQPVPEMESESYLNERIKKAVDRVKSGFANAKAYYNRSPRLQKTTYQGKYLPAFWTVACIFSLLVNVILIAILIAIGRNFFSMKTSVADGLLAGASENLALMDKAHIVDSVPVETKIQLVDDLPVVFNLPISQSTQLILAQDTRISGAYIYLNNTAVETDLTLPARTPIQVNMNMSVPVDVSIPVSMTVPVSLKVPVDIAVNQTDLHQSIVGLQEVIEPYKTVMETNFNSPRDFSFCNKWWSGWMCSVFFGK